jgi:fructoselysine-6-P-deglycase FrlB-like protein
MEISHKVKDYATTIALAAIPVVIAYQAEIGKYIPVEYALLFTIGMGILSQLAGNARVKEAYQDTSAGIDTAQAKAQEYQDMIAKLQSEIDERQALVDAVITPSTPIEEPVDGQ